ncbi:PREDICTED: protein DDI1 homolog 2-like isoform X3 [Amphimedon queenslandica]|uniref:UBA domain-containing protein n=1 Tax=Amphimedon queenslandica TaxID=400682 RepID=A0AAN0IWQ9_AMPQE|nr:PREDICTED: protein DDI1 homolog 2-like isoform X3 [Amphimedon queenslandica]|eukprot:XP_019848992.1 PREDICTED: protein DDI1 homolog 2-like isoform X3 [Amphimedon queenslandica]
MQIVVSTIDGNVYPFDVSEELPLNDLKALLSMETNIPQGSLILYHNMQELRERAGGENTLTSLGVQDKDIVVVANRQDVRAPPTTGQTQTLEIKFELPNIDWNPISISQSRLQPAGTAPLPSTEDGLGTQLLGMEPEGLESFDPVTFIQYFLSDSEEMSILRQQNPQLAEAVATGNINTVKQYYKEELMGLEREMQELEGLDPMSSEYQEKVADNICQRRKDFKMALNPEIVTSRVIMLYVQVKVNGVSVKAMVDTGAQMTIMNTKCAERCNVMRLVDRRGAGVAVGVGRQRIIGVVHMCQVQVGQDYLASSFRVLEDQSHELILGLDMLKRHQCIVDLSKGVLRVGTTGAETHFLSEKEVEELSMAQHKQEERGIIEDEDREIASLIQQSEQEYQERTGEAPPPSPPPQLVPEDDIQRVMSAGFTREQAIAGLRECGGDTQRTIAALLARMFRF